MSTKHDNILSAGAAEARPEGRSRRRPFGAGKRIPKGLEKKLVKPPGAVQLFGLRHFAAARFAGKPPLINRLIHIIHRVFHKEKGINAGFLKNSVVRVADNFKNRPENAP
jgi:hypothetical protein